MSIGSGVGESVVTSCNLSKLPLKTIGLGNNPFAYGATECNVTDYIPSIYEEGYIPAVIEKCKAYNIDLIIPGSDDEALILSKNKAAIENEGFTLIASDHAFINLTRNKDKLCHFLNEIAPICVKNIQKELVNNQIKAGLINFPLIAKPKNGCASRGIMILLNKKDIDSVPADYIIQELAKPGSRDSNYPVYLSQINNKINPQLAEISIQIVTDKNGDLIGKMASYNKLNNGVPIEVIPYNNQTIWEKIDIILPTLKEWGLKGPVNIQGRLTDDGFKIFEMNPRFTGITGLRALMGFNEVERCIQKWTGIKNDAPLDLNDKRIGVRQTKDKIISIYNNKKLKKIAEDLNSLHYIESNKNILITGASGYLGRSLVMKLLQIGYTVFAFGREKVKLRKIFSDHSNLKLFDQDDYNSSTLKLGLVDVLIHCGFARPFYGKKAIIRSMEFTNRLFQDAGKYQIPTVINISSQSVYGKNNSDFNTEKTDVDPDDFYALAKYSSELSANGIKYLNESTNVTSLRLSTLSGGQSGFVDLELIATFVKKVINNEIIQIYDGSQILQRMDVRDASQGIIELLKTDTKTWESVYNLGVKEFYAVKEIAEKVCEIGEKRFTLNGRIEIFHDNIPLSIKLDSSKFYQLTNWYPQFSIDDIILSLYQYYLN